MVVSTERKDPIRIQWTNPAGPSDYYDDWEKVEEGTPTENEDQKKENEDQKKENEDQKKYRLRQAEW
jgi:hypothetical protein